MLNNTGGKTLQLDEIKELFDLEIGLGRGERCKVYGKVRKGCNAQSLIWRAGEREVATSSIYTVSLAVAVGMRGMCDLLESLLAW